MIAIPEDATPLPGVQPQIVRTVEEVQRAHDLLGAIMLGDLPVRLNREDEHRVTFYYEALCWLLSHAADGETFARKLRALEGAMRRRGLRLIKSDVLVQRPARHRLKSGRRPGSGKPIDPAS